MIKFNKKKRTLTFTGKEDKLVRAYAKKHKLTFKEVVYLAIINGVAKGAFNEKNKDPNSKRLQKLRSALRGVWQYDPLRKAVITSVVKDKQFQCPICLKLWPVEMATVDHVPPVGSFTMLNIGDWINRLFFGEQRTICKLCHKKVTAEQKRAK